MPLPLIVPILVAASGAFGVGKGVQALVRNKKAKDLNISAKELVEQMEQQLDHSRELCNETLASLGQEKVDSLRYEITDFVNIYSKIKNVDLNEEAGIDSLRLGEFSNVLLNEMRVSCSLFDASTLGLGTGAAGGALTAFGAYSGTMMFASAGTGTAISTLSGVAASNATLAWLGNGTLAAGGYGVAGGTIVLGVLTTGPALLIFGSFLNAKAGKNLDKAKSNQEQAQTYADEVSLILTALNGIYDLALLAKDTLAVARKQLANATERLNSIVNVCGEDYREFNQNARNVVFKAVKIAQLTKVLIDTPILDQDGNLLSDSEANISRFADHLATL